MKGKAMAVAAFAAVAPRADPGTTGDGRSDASGSAIVLG